jgi:cation:H+ antiporter
LAFLGMATLYAFLAPIKGSLAWYDGLVFLALYAWYIVLAGRRPCSGLEIEGPAALLVQLPKTYQRLATGGLFLFAAAAILANAEPFCEGLVATGKLLHINEFLLVQWLAPIASEAPEFTVALVFAWRGQAGLALGSLLSSKLNQWTLLVGMIPGIFAVSHRSLAHPIPMGPFQMDEILLTAAQSLFAVALLASLQLDLAGAFLLFLLFVGQLVLPEIVDAFPHAFPGVLAGYIHPLFTALYTAGAVALIVSRPRHIMNVFRGLKPHA